ncbi:MAG: hypothetical protein K1000chlam2_00036 [Chlamydiae bacterium]|nr:hypothetical protein [Chlamydiota bacterium]
MTVIFEGDAFEDKQDFKIFTHAHDIHSCIWEARQHIRERLKYAEDVSDQEAKNLEELSEMLYMEELD